MWGLQLCFVFTRVKASNYVCCYVLVLQNELNLRETPPEGGLRYEFILSPFRSCFCFKLGWSTEKRKNLSKVIFRWHIIGSQQCSLCHPQKCQWKLDKTLGIWPSSPAWWIVHVSFMSEWCSAPSHVWAAECIRLSTDDINVTFWTCVCTNQVLCTNMVLVCACRAVCWLMPCRCAFLAGCGLDAQLFWKSAAHWFSPQLVVLYRWWSCSTGVKGSRITESKEEKGFLGYIPGHWRGTLRKVYWSK